MSRQLLVQVVTSLADLAQACNAAMEADLFEGPEFMALRDAAQRYVVAYGALELAAAEPEMLDPETVSRLHANNVLGLTRPLNTRKGAL